jgi:predicted protein tyrosine phosphatase
MRSITAQNVFQNDHRFEVKSAGTDKLAAVCISDQLLDWADTIVVMEKHHRNTIRSKFPLYYEKKRIVCLYIPDEYDYMQPELIGILKDKVEVLFKKGLPGSFGI